MKLLVVAATLAEIKPFLSANQHVNHLITGVGVPAAIFELTHYMVNNEVDFIIQAGICGSFSLELFPIGKVVHVSTDCFADLGAVENHTLQTVFELGFEDADIPPYSKGVLVNESSGLAWDYLSAAKGITVNTISDSIEHVALYQQKFGAEVESMEGAALHYVGNVMGVPYCQLRSVSNAVGNRNKKEWNIPLAIANLNADLRVVVERYCNSEKVNLL